MLMASIVASMMVGGFLLTMTGELGDDDLTDASDDADAGNDLYADDNFSGARGLEGWGDLLTDLMEDDALSGGPEAVNAHAFAPEGTTDLAQGMDLTDENADFEQDLASSLNFEDPPEMVTLFGGPWTTDGTEVVIDDFVPGQDELLIGYDAGSDVPEIDLFGDPAGNALVFADGHLTVKVMGADGLVQADDVRLVAETPSQSLEATGDSATV